MTQFYLGTHHPGAKWFAAGVPLFVSVRRLRDRKTLPRATAPWCLDSGAFTCIARWQRFDTSEDDYVADVRYLAGIGLLAWAAPRDWMCEPWIVAATGLSVREHQERTVASFVSLRAQLGPLVIPVLQGYAPVEYERCIALYQDAGVALDREPVVGLGSVCKRSSTSEARRLIHYLSDHGLRFHGFGLKGTTYRALRGLLASADSMAWSYAARRAGRNSNSIQEALTWRERLLAA